jgi:hypothetical protein
MLEILDQRSSVSLQSRKQALFLVGVMIGRGAIEIFHDGASGGASIVVATMLRQVTLQPAERRELALDAAMAGNEHCQRIIESGRDRARVGCDGHR